MFIEIRQAGFTNKGAELMIRAIVEKVDQFCPNARYTMVPNRNSAPFEKRMKCGFYQGTQYWKYGFQWGKIFDFFPRDLRSRYGLVLDREVSVVLDAAGFRYGDQFRSGNCVELAHSCKRWKKHGVKIILLPQALGPFDRRKTKNAIKEVADCADLIFARENESYENITNVVGERPNIKLAPDFTNLLEGIVPEWHDEKKHQFCIVPNYRMMDKTCKKVSEAYLLFLIKTAAYLIQNKIKPFFLIHEGSDDYELAKRVNQEVGDVLEIIQESDPLKIKGALGSCIATIGSRYHGLVSALSQGVPCLATSWTHKYKLLLDDYGFSDGMITLPCSDEDLYQKLDVIINSKSRKEIASTIKNKSIHLKRKTENMWKTVQPVLLK